jgi:hypothetical protein
VTLSESVEDLKNIFMVQQQLIDDKIYQNYLFKKSRLVSTGKICESGFHFSHFYSLEKTIEKLKLISDDKNINAE